MISGPELGPLPCVCAAKHLKFIYVEKLNKNNIYVGHDYLCIYLSIKKNIESGMCHVQ